MSAIALLERWPKLIDECYWFMSLRAIRTKGAARGCSMHQALRLIALIGLLLAQAACSKCDVPTGWWHLPNACHSGAPVSD